MLMPPMVYFAAGLATHSVTVAGDFRQLAPIVMSDSTLAERWLKRDVFQTRRHPRACQASGAATRIGVAARAVPHAHTDMRGGQRPLL